MTDYYALIKSAFMVKARTISPYIVQSWQVTDDDTDANRGADCFMIFRPGSVGLAPQNTKKIIKVDWTLIFDMQIRYKNYKTSWSLFEEFRTAILNKFVFTDDPFLDIPFFEDLVIQASEEPGQKPANVASPTWIGQTLRAIITQRIVRI
jgi:hypothetical protein